MTFIARLARPTKPRIWLLPVIAFSAFIYAAIAGVVVVSIVGVEHVVSHSVVTPENINIPINWAIIPIIGPALEEALFRALLLGGLVKLLGSRWIGIILSVQAVLFGLSHGNIYNLPIQGVLGAMLGIVFLRFALPKQLSVKGIFHGWLAAFFVHAMFNSIIFGLAQLALSLQAQ